MANPVASSRPFELIRPNQTWNRPPGFAERQRGSHHIFRKEGVPERLVLQRDGSHAKPYQVRQVRKVTLNYRLGERE
ncbi:MAG: type II toxin-antitoxin system HicA family toxin [Gemmatimonadetes bacterium]|nr:type II toxin-antitoxin system HicA family toxin [Gemmatimonadota bacterium]MYH54385.1 type II toxin-antitoxin system HicA family toxin [Gemmatimonadota bacterium]MYK67412.1 type II toxin-antitoxin system HicA family toxin [Gemmatimonadota bacterium]